MITAKEALNLAKPTEEDIVMVRAAMRRIDKHIRAKMTFAGPEALEMQPDKLSFTAAKVVAVVMKRDGWNVSISLGIKQSPLGGQSTIWQLMFSPMIEVYEAALADLNFESATLSPVA